MRISLAHDALRAARLRIERREILESEIRIPKSKTVGTFAEGNRFLNGKLECDLALAGALSCLRSTNAPASNFIPLPLVSSETLLFKL
jgi:hypothetical protein